MIRLAIEEDAKALALVHIKSWREIYKAIFPHQVLDTLDAAKHQAYWRSFILESPFDTVVYEREQAVIGFLSLGRSNDDDTGESAGEIMSVYLDPPYWRCGYGGALIDWAVSQAEHRKWQRLTLWSLQRNSRGRAFYESVGFLPDGLTKCGCLNERFSGVEAITVTLMRFSRSIVAVHQ